MNFNTGDVTKSKLDEFRALSANLAPTMAPYVAPPPPEPERPPAVTYSALANPPAGGSSTPSVDMPSGPGNLTVGQAHGLSPAEAWIIRHESGGNPNAWNNTVVYDQGRRLGNAFGLGQIVSDTPRASRSTDVNSQLRDFRNYVKNRYGNADNAVAFWKAHNWY